MVVLAGVAGLLMRAGGSLAAPGRSVLFGLCFLAASLLDGDLQHLWQRRASGRGSLLPTTVALSAALALAGPALSWWLLETLFQLVGGLDFTQAYTAALYGVVWAAALWPRPEPVAMAWTIRPAPSGGARLRSCPATPWETRASSPIR